MTLNCQLNGIEMAVPLHGIGAALVMVTAALVITMLITVTPTVDVDNVVDGGGDCPPLAYACNREADSHRGDRVVICAMAMMF